MLHPENLSDAPLYIYIYIIVLVKMCRFGINVVNFFFFFFICTNHYSVGPSNTSQWQHRRKEATEQIKKPALAGSRTQVSATLGLRAYRYATGAVT